MKIVVGKEYRIVKPKDVGEEPGWVSRMDFLDGMIFKVEKVRPHCPWVYHKNGWALNPNWLVPVNEFKGN